MVGSLLAWNSLLTYWEDLSMSRDVLGRPDGNASFDSRIASLRRTFRQLLHLNVEKKEVNPLHITLGRWMQIGRCSCGVSTAIMGDVPNRTSLTCTGF